jgi:hypothetical protein
VNLALRQNEIKVNGTHVPLENLVGKEELWPALLNWSNEDESQ